MVGGGKGRWGGRDKDWDLCVLMWSRLFLTKVGTTGLESVLD